MSNRNTKTTAARGRPGIQANPVAVQTLANLKAQQQVAPAPLASQFETASNELHGALSMLEDITGGLAQRLNPVRDISSAGTNGAAAPVSSVAVLSTLQAATGRVRALYDQVQALHNELVV